MGVAKCWQLDLCQVSLPILLDAFAARSQVDTCKIHMLVSLKTSKKSGTCSFEKSSLFAFVKRKSILQTSPRLLFILFTTCDCNAILWAWSLDVDLGWEPPSYILRHDSRLTSGEHVAQGGLSYSNNPFGTT